MDLCVNFVYFANRTNTQAQIQTNTNTQAHLQIQNAKTQDAKNYHHTGSNLKIINFKIIQLNIFTIYQQSYNLVLGFLICKTKIQKLVQPTLVGSVDQFSVFDAKTVLINIRRGTLTQGIEAC